MQRYFFLTDIMKTGNHVSYERFLDSHLLPDQEIEHTGEYFNLHNYNLDSYDRKFALVDRNIPNQRFKNNSEFKAELQKRCQLLHSQGFKFIMASPWESLENVNTMERIYPKEIGGLDYFNWTGGVSWFWWYMYDKHLNSKFKFNHSNKLHDFLYLNKQPREHRVKLFNKLKQENLLDKSLYTFLGEGTDVISINRVFKDEIGEPIRLPEEYELPWVDRKNYPQYGMDQDIFELPYNDTNYSLVSETNDNNYEVFMTEKIWKPIMAQHVFVVHGNHLYLQKLREIGFKTFGSYFDESYDLEHNRDKKIDAIVSLCKDLKTVNWQDIYRQTISLRQHDYDTFFNKEKLSEQVNKTLISFLEFFDSSQVSS